MIQKHIARFVDELRFFLGLGTRHFIGAELIGMVCDNQLAVSLLDVLFRGAFLKAKGFERF